MHLVADARAATVPGVSPPQVAVRIRVADPRTVDPRRVDALLEATKPAHVTHNYLVADRARSPTERAGDVAEPRPRRR